MTEGYLNKVTCFEQVHHHLFFKFGYTYLFILFQLQLLLFYCNKAECVCVMCVCSAVQHKQKKTEVCVRLLFLWRPENRKKRCFIAIISFIFFHRALD